MTKKKWVTRRKSRRIVLALLKKNAGPPVVKKAEKGGTARGRRATEAVRALLQSATKNVVLHRRLEKGKKKTRPIADESVSGKIVSPAQSKEAKKTLDHYRDCPDSEKVHPDGHWTKIELSARDMRTLAADTWLNDNVIDFYIRCHARQAMPDNVFQKGGTELRVLLWQTQFWQKLSGEGNPPGEGTPKYDYAKVRRWSTRRHVDVSML